MGVQNLILIKNRWSNSVVDLVVSLHDSHCFCKWRPNTAVHSLLRPQKIAILSYGFSFVAVVGSQNSDSLQKLVVNIGC